MYNLQNSRDLVTRDLFFIVKTMINYHQDIFGVLSQSPRITYIMVT